MKFKSISISNFRNFEDICVSLSNKNVFIGMNDVGKTNFLYAFRYVFDRNVRRSNLSGSDFHKRNYSKPVEILVCISIADVDNPDSQKLRAKVKGALKSDQDTVYIKLVAKYDEEDMSANPVLFWGGSKNDLREMPTKGNLFEIDYVFNVIYIDAFVDLYAFFKRNSRQLLEDDDGTDSRQIDSINSAVDELNDAVSSLSGVQDFEKRIKDEYETFRSDSTEVSVKSEIAVNNLYSSFIPYIKRDDDDNLYPTAGEGRKKLLVYSIHRLLAEKTGERRINLFFVEEPENHLHRSLQLALSRQLFVGEQYTYLFMTTHSSFVLAEIDNVSLVRVYNESKIDSASKFYQIPREFRNQKRLFNKGLTEAIFADRVLLVEGPSEELLFGKVLSVRNPSYEADGIYILEVSGINFFPYVKILKALGIECVVKTDNDLRSIKDEGSVELLGFKRVNKLIDEQRLDETACISQDTPGKRDLYDKNQDVLDSIRDECSVHLSRVSLEEDLDEAIHDALVQYLPEATDGNVVAYLQKSKKYHMAELIKRLTDEDCDKIFNHYNFECLQDLLGRVC